MTSIFSEMPAAVSRLGADLFLKLPLLRSRLVMRPVYINRRLYREIWGSDASWAQMCEEVAAIASVTIDEDASDGTQLGYAYIDRQADPLGLSLAGNRGAGRAYYFGKHFNLKGEKTPFARSPRPRFSDGVLEIERAIWETLVGNSLHGSVMKTAEVLAVIDTGESCAVAWQGEPARRARVLRYDPDGALDRVSHMFERGAALSEQRLRDIAANFGAVEAQKFMHRLLHGAWSAGNISPDGAMIDFDTSCAVKGRHAQYSSSRWHIENYFGREAEGQEKILHALAEDARLNLENIHGSNLARSMQETFEATVAQTLPILMGFPASAGQHAPEALSALARRFLKLTRIFYPKYDALSAREALSHSLHLFDFSSLFRHYPLLKREQRWNKEEGLSLMVENSLLDSPFLETGLDTLPELAAAQPYLDRVNERLHPHAVNAFQRAALEAEAHEFMRAYEAVFTMLQNHTGMTLDAVGVHAYAVNEDRSYLFPAYSPARIFVQWLKEPECMQWWMERAIEASQRVAQARRYRLGWRAFKQGWFYWEAELDGTCRPCFDWMAEIPNDQKEWVLHLDGRTLALRGDMQGAHLALKGDAQDIRIWLDRAHRESDLLFTKSLIFCNNLPLPLSDLLTVEH